MDNNAKVFQMDMFNMASTISDVKLSPSGDKLAYIQKTHGKNQIMVRNIDETYSKQLSWKPEPGGGFGSSFNWSPDGRFIIYKDKKSKLHKIAIEGGDSIQITFEDKKAANPQISPDAEKVIYTADTEDASYLAYTYTDGIRWPQNTGVNLDFIQDPVWSPNNELFTFMAYNNPDMPWDNSGIYIGDLKGNYDIIPSLKGLDNIAVCQPRWSPNGKYLTYICDKNGYMNLWIADSNGDNAKCVYQTKNDIVTPSWGSGNVNYVWSKDGKYIVFTLIENASMFLYVHTLKTGTTKKLTDIGGIYSSLNIANNKIYCIYEKTNLPKEIVSIDLQSGDKNVIASPSVIGISSYTAREPIHINWKNKDGSIVYGLFYQAQNIKREPAPLLIMVHGGPTGIYTNSWDTKAHYFTSRGWNILAVNYRGSGGYGREYLQSLRGNWGVYDVEDCKSGAEYLIKAGKVKKDEIAIMGGSAGGYTVLMSLATYPDFYKAGISLYGVVDLYELMLSTHRLEKYYTNTLVGSLPDAKEKFKERSPLYNVDKIKSPLYIFQGDKDDVVNKEQAEMLVNKLKRNNTVFEYEIFKDEGHGFSNKSRTEAYNKIIKFLDKYVINS